MAAAHGGQILVSHATEELVRDVCPTGRVASISASTASATWRARAGVPGGAPGLRGSSRRCARWSVPGEPSGAGHVVRGPRRGAGEAIAEALLDVARSSPSPALAVSARPASRSRSRRSCCRGSPTARGCASSRRERRRAMVQWWRRRWGCHRARGRRSARASFEFLRIESCCSCSTTASTSSTPAGGSRRRCCGSARRCGSWRRAARRSAWRASRCGRAVAAAARRDWSPDAIGAERRGAAVRRARRSGAARVRVRRVERGGGRGDLPAARRHPAGDRARRGAGVDHDPGRDRAPCSTTLPAAHRRAPRAVERHQTLRAAVDWSYGLLDDRRRARVRPARRVRRELRRRAAAGGRGRRRVRGVGCARRSPSWSRSPWSSPRDRRGTTRYQMLETLGPYARERLDRRVHAEAARHAEHFARFAEAAGPGLGTRRVRVAAASRRRARQPPGRGALGPRSRRARRHLASPSASSARSPTRRIMDRHGHRGVGGAPRAPGRARVRRTVRTAVLAAAAFSAQGRNDVEAMRELTEAALRDGVPPNCPGAVWAFIARAASEGMAGDWDSAIRRDRRRRGRAARRRRFALGPLVPATPPRPTSTTSWATTRRRRATPTSRSKRRVARGTRPPPPARQFAVGGRG